jgi:ABC-type sugar transport system permease subunit
LRLNDHAAGYRRLMGNPGRTGPSRAWFIVPCILLIAALALAGIGFSSFVSFARSEVRTYEPGTSVSVSEDGFTLYTLDSNTTQTAGLRCTANRPGMQVRLQPISGRISWSNGKDTFVAIASTPPDVPPGRYAISCVGAFGESEVPLYLGPRLDLGAVTRLVGFNIITPVLLSVLAVGLFAILAILRYRKPREPASPGTPAAPT